MICPACHIEISFTESTKSQAPRYCPFCKADLNATDTLTTSHDPQHDSSHSTHAPYVSFLPEHIPGSDQVQFMIGPYQVLKSIGKGGMGEVFLVYDTSFGRRIALKQIRTDLTKHHQLHNRFLKEARITSQLTHPAIISIYSIHISPEITYYTMPYIEGETLKQMLQKARKQEKYGNKTAHITESIPSFIRIFLSICQAVAYAHSKKILHRDLKPENIIVGKYGQIVILDWGLAKLLKDKEETAADATVETDPEPNPLHHLTHVGKIVGTLTYMAPERALGKPATFQTDIYSLGVILYQLLTLKQPFRRESLKLYRQNIHKEVLIDPIDAAPYRDVPKSLSRIVMKCLAVMPEQRYFSVDQLIHDVENYIEGRSEWFQITELSIQNKQDWEFQENVLIAEHTAISPETEVSDWVSLMISKASFQDTIKLEAKIKIGEGSNGIGFLMSIPEAGERLHLNDGYCLWLGTERYRSTKLLRSTVEVMSAPDVYLQPLEWIDIRIEKFENKIHLYFNHVLQFSYISHLPLAGTHVGLIMRDDDFSLKSFNVFICSQNIMVNCLAVPDAFLAHKEYTIALNEYRRIGYSFPGRAEGREAMFRAGITILEEAGQEVDPDKKNHCFDLAQEEFHKLSQTPGAPLEYLGKALVYQRMGDVEEEVKCFELTYRKYHRHPLLPVVHEHMIYRMYESARQDRRATFHFILLSLIYLPTPTVATHTKKLINSLEKQWEPLPFMELESIPDPPFPLSRYMLGTKLSFWLARPFTLHEIIGELLKMEILSAPTIGNALFSLFELGSYQMATDRLKDVVDQFTKRKMDDFNEQKKWFKIIAHSVGQSMEEAAVQCIQAAGVLDHPSFHMERALLFIMQTALDLEKYPIVERLYHGIHKEKLSPQAQILHDGYQIWNYLLQDKVNEAGKLFNRYPPEVLHREGTLLHFLYGCHLYIIEGKEIAYLHFSGIFEVPYPKSWSLLGYFLEGKITDEGVWGVKAFLWEKRQLYRQLALFYHCIGDTVRSEEYRHKSTHLFIE